jgi:hypothetical protein
MAKDVTKGRGMRPVAVQMGVPRDGFAHGGKGRGLGTAAEDYEVMIWKVASLREAGTR